MLRKWLPLNALRAFEAAGNHLSFTAAANSLTVAQSAVSRHVIVLERFLGVQLFERRPQQLVLTDAGRHLLPVVTRAFDRIDGALTEIIKERGQPKRTLKLLLPPTFAHRLAIPLLKDFRAEHPDLTLEITSLSSSDSEADIAVEYAEPRATDAIHDLLWTPRLTLLCSPRLAATAKPGDMAGFIAANDLLHVRIDGRARHFIWEILARQLGLPAGAVDRGLVFDTAQLAVQYALSGEGIALVDPLLFPDEIASGALLRPYDIAIGDGYGYYMTIPPEELDNADVALFRTWLINRYAGIAAEKIP